MKEFLLKIRDDIFGILPKEYSKNLTIESIFYRSINFIFFSYLMSLYIYIPFLVYMSNYGFFSYDLFNNGIFAINLIALYVVIFLVVLSIMITGGFSTIFACKLSGCNTPKNNKYLIYLNIFVLVLFILFIYEDSSLTENIINNLVWIIFLFIISFPISLHMALIFFGSTKSQFFSIIFSFCFLLPFLFFNVFPESTSKLTSKMFKIFGIGGNIPIQIEYRLDNKIIYIGKLIFLSPDNIFLSNEEGTIILERKDSEIIFLKKQVK